MPTSTANLQSQRLCVAPGDTTFATHLRLAAKPMLPTKKVKHVQHSLFTAALFATAHSLVPRVVSKPRACITVQERRITGK